MLGKSIYIALIEIKQLYAVGHFSFLCVLKSLKSHSSISIMKTVYLILATALLAGCTVNKTPVPVKSSEVVGVVRLGFDLAPLQTAKVDTYVAQSAASHQCQQWGYIAAYPYGEPIKTCSVTSGAVCLSQKVTLEYQCRGVGMERYLKDESVVQ